MKTHLMYLSGLLFCGLAFPVSAQIGGPVPPATGTWANVRHNQYIRWQNRSARLPAEGFWVYEDTIRHPCQLVVHYYDDQKHEVQTDTLRQKRLNLKHRAIVGQLNERLAEVLQHHRQYALASTPSTPSKGLPPGK